MSANPAAQTVSRRDHANSRARHPRLSTDERNAFRKYVVARYGSGRSIREIAREAGRSYGLIHRLLQEAGIPRRSRGGRPALDTATDSS